MKKFIYICEWLLFIFSLLLIPFFKDKISTIIIIPICILLYYLIRKINIKHYSIFLFIIALLIRLISIIYLKVEVTDDFKMMLEASKSLVKGDLSFTNLWYFKTFSYQLGHVLYQALLLKIINKVFFLKIINSLVTSLSIVFIYKITKKLFKEETARVISFAYLFYLYPIYLNSVLTNQLIPALIYLLVIYLIINKENNIKLYIIIGLLLSIANFLRTESIVFILGIIIYNLITITKKNYKNILKYTSMLVITYLVVNTIISSLVYISPIKTKLVNNSPYWKFYCGLSDKHNGLYNEEDQTVFFNSNNQKELLIDRIKEENIKIPILILKKEVILWTQTNYDLRIKNNINDLVLKWNQGYLNIIIILFVISLFPNKNLKNKKLLLLKIIIALYIGVYAFIEISPRYACILHILLFLLIPNAIEKLKRGD